MKAFTQFIFLANHCGLDQGEQVGVGRMHCVRFDVCHHQTCCKLLCWQTTTHSSRIDHTSCVGQHCCILIHHWIPCEINETCQTADLCAAVSVMHRHSIVLLLLQWIVRELVHVRATASSPASVVLDLHVDMQVVERTSSQVHRNQTHGRCADGQLVATKGVASQRVQIGVSLFQRQCTWDHSGVCVEQIGVRVCCLTRAYTFSARR